MIRELASELLSVLGFRVFLAASADEALRIFNEKKQDIDAVIIDLIMPKTNGVTCFHRIREIDKQVPVIISSGISEASTKQTLLNMGATAFLEKPYNVQILRETFKSINK